MCVLMRNTTCKLNCGTPEGATEDCLPHFFDFTNKNSEERQRRRNIRHNLTAST